MNIKLTRELESTIEKYEQLSVRFKKLKFRASPKVKVNSSVSKDISKYAYFVSQKSQATPEIKEYIDERLQDHDLIELIQFNQETALLITLQVISDLIVNSLNLSNSNLKSPNRGVIQENESLLHSISEHNLRIARLNKEISRNPGLNDIIQRKEMPTKTPTPLLIDN